MAELTIRPEEIRDALAQFVEEYEPESASLEEVGTVTECGDGIARVEGLPSAMANELLEFEDGTRGLALNLDVREIGVVILGDFSKIEEGQQVRRTGEILSVPVGDSFLGRVVDPLGNPLDGKGEIGTTELRPLETQAPSVVQRQSVNQPLQTGIKAIDAMTAIGRGQRQLIIGDRQTGKTAICIDTIINQRANWESGDPELQVRCIYVAIGQRGSNIASIRQSLEEAGAMEYTTIVASPASDPSGFKYIAPYTGSAIGQHWMYEGKHALIVFDDLSKQAEAYRAISLLLRRPPGREAYPGDVFYLHSRLLERCAKLSDDLGGGSLTGLPIVETKGNDISAYIPTNVISITDGQIFLETDLFNSGVRPAINVGRSVSRVGSAAQVRAMKKVAGTLRLALSQFRDLESFAAFASDLDAASRAQLDRGARLVELLKQPQYDPFPMEQEVVSIWAGTNGHLDDVPVDDVSRFESEFLDSLKRNNAGILDSIRETRDLTDDTAAALKDAIEQFRRTFEKGNGELLVADEDEPEAMGEDEAGHEKVTRYTGQDGGQDGQSGDGQSGDGQDGQSGDGAVDANSPSEGESGASRPSGGAAGGNSGPSAGASDVNGPSGGASATAQPAGGNTPGGEPGSGD
jgi:F-type H+/Na+-transporting ATPase subunit alpha